MSSLPSGAVRAAAEAMQAREHLIGEDRWREDARVALEAAMPIIERHVRREVGRELAPIDHWSLRFAVKRVARGLPALTEKQAAEKGAAL